MKPFAFVPVHVRARSAPEFHVESVPVADGGPVEPFFFQSVERWLTRPATLVFRKLETESALVERTRASNVRVSGLVMHTSHCGSTLVAQTLALRERTVVLSEPSTLDVALSGLRSGDDPERCAAFVRALVLAQAAPFLPDGGDVVLKPEAPQLAYLPIFRLAFPSARWVFLHRNLDAVLAANLRTMGGGLLPGRTDPSALGLPADLAHTEPLESYAGRLIAAIGTRALDLDASDPGYFVDHASLSPAAIERIANHFGLPIDEPTRERIAERVRRDAKDPGAPFVPRDAPPPSPRELAEVFARTREALVARTARG